MMREASSHLLASPGQSEDHEAGLKHSRSDSQTSPDASTGIGCTDEARIAKTGFDVRRICQLVLPAIIALVPLILLAVFSPALTRKLGYDGCLPNGEFALPYTNSIWNINYFFLITIPFLGSAGSHTCSNGGGAVLQFDSTRTCAGYSFTAVKVIDAAWDLLVGRGAQLVLSIIGYRLFSRVLKALMQTGEVGYDAFAAVVFNGGDIRSVKTLLRYAANRTPIPRTLRARVAYLAMAITTLYIVALPTLLSAMTGYTSFYAPAMSVYTNGSFTTNQCGENILPAWGYTTTEYRHENYYIYESMRIDYDHPPDAPLSAGPDYIDYYHRYEPIFTQCSSYSNFTLCPAANTTSWIWNESGIYGKNESLKAPMLAVTPYPNITGPLADITKYGHWDCNELIIDTYSLTMFIDQAERSRLNATVTGICQAGGGYAWGFSFLLTFVVCVLNVGFLGLMYGLWFGICGSLGMGEESDEFKDAVMMVTQAEKEFGPDISTWSAKDLYNDVLRGSQSMTVTHRGFRQS